MRAWLPVALASLAAPAAGCRGSCVVYELVITAEDQSTGELVCEARVTVGAGDAGLDGGVVDASSAPSDAEVSLSSSACQWDTLVSGGVFTVAVTSPGFLPASATVTLSNDTCGTATAPVQVLLARAK